MSAIGVMVSLALLLVSTAVAVPAEAQQTAKAARIGFLSPSSSSDARIHEVLEVFRQSLRDLGYVEGRTISIEARWADGKYDRLPALAAELVRLRVDVIVAVAAPAIRAVRDATGTIPIVMAVVVDPVATGFVASLARPGGNITGLSTSAPALVAKQLEMLREVSPRVSRVGALWNPANPGNAPQLREAEIAAKRLGLQLQPVAARTPGELDGAFATMSRTPVDAVIVLADVIFNEHRGRIAELAARTRLPAVYGLQEHVEAGGLMGYFADRSELFRRAATYVDKILKGARPADLPVEQPTRFELIVNLRTAKALGITIPASLLLRADRVIE
jgi:putative ABC transport system substrate-binding protein